MSTKYGRDREISEEYRDVFIGQVANSTKKAEIWKEAEKYGCVINVLNLGSPNDAKKNRMFKVTFKNSIAADRCVRRFPVKNN